MYTSLSLSLFLDFFFWILLHKDPSQSCEPAEVCLTQTLRGPQCVMVSWFPTLFLPASYQHQCGSLASLEWAWQHQCCVPMACCMVIQRHSALLLAFSHRAASNNPKVSCCLMSHLSGSSSPRGLCICGFGPGPGPPSGCNRIPGPSSTQ